MADNLAHSTESLPPSRKARWLCLNSQLLHNRRPFKITCLEKKDDAAKACHCKVACHGSVGIRQLERLGPYPTMRNHRLITDARAARFANHVYSDWGVA